MKWTFAQMEGLRDCLVSIEPAQLEQIIHCVRQHPHEIVFTGELEERVALSSPEGRVRQAFADFDQVAMIPARARGVKGRTAVECLRRMRIIAESDSQVQRLLRPGVLDCLRSYEWTHGWDWAWGRIPTAAEIRSNKSL